MAGIDPALRLKLKYSVGVGEIATDAAPAPPVDTDKDVFVLQNQEREKAGLPAYSWNALLAQAAQSRANEELANINNGIPMRHENFPQDIEDMGFAQFHWAGENLAEMSARPDMDVAVMQAWMNSPEHRSNILDPDFSECGVAHAGTDLMIWAVEFLAP